ncbi:hypothetical protein CYMTET_6011 [Cymbomonas tetramitiformis]|uniref:Prolyl 4-hydroxylase alpha subunit domain-containing protein n=1 Tax=Cymbomonas tetramitiformis TaxID=36881 RepID=A0AAE0GY01_9CHLO|nr:hypothetical protein CYMTET_6011 [Cymbomonas tetramitiformis]
MNEKEERSLSQDEPNCCCNGKENSSPNLPNVHYLHGLFSDDFIQACRDDMLNILGSTSSNNMYAERFFTRSADLAADLLRHLPPELNIRHVLSDMKYISYPAGGYIAPHVDGIRTDEETGIPSTTSFLLYLEDIPEGEGGETEFLRSIDDDEVLLQIVPRAGSILIFPHTTPHRGAGVGLYPKVLLRGDMY